MRPPTGSRCHPRRCGVWRVRRRSCRSCSTAPARCWTAVATSGSRTGRSGGRCGRCTAPAATPAATSRSTVATSTTSSNGSNTDRPISTICCRSAVRHHHLVHEGRWRLTLDKHRVVTIHRPDGTRHFHGSTTNRSGHAPRRPAATSAVQARRRSGLWAGPAPSRRQARHERRDPRRVEAAASGGSRRDRSRRDLDAPARPTRPRRGRQ